MNTDKTIELTIIDECQKYDFYQYAQDQDLIECIQEIIQQDRAQRQAQPLTGKQAHANGRSAYEVAQGKAIKVLFADLPECERALWIVKGNAPPPAQAALTVDLPERVVDTVAQSMGLSGPFTQDFYDFAQALMHEVLARVPSR
jgi:hypothetical protein